MSLEEGVAYRMDREGNIAPLAVEHEGASVALPGVTPDESWTHEQLEAYAASEGVDFGSARSKGERLGVLAAHVAAGQPALPAE